MVLFADFLKSKHLQSHRRKFLVLDRVDWEHGVLLFVRLYKNSRLGLTRFDGLAQPARPCQSAPSASSCQPLPISLGTLSNGSSNVSNLKQSYCQIARNKILAGFITIISACNFFGVQEIRGKDRYPANPPYIFLSIYYYLLTLSPLLYWIYYHSSSLCGIHSVCLR
jgi:hypothetical protein